MGKNPWIAFAIVAGHMLTVVSIYLLVTTSIFVFSAQRTTGVITSVERLPNHRVSHVTVRFLSSGRNIQFSQATKFYAMKEGDPVPVVYASNDPEGARIGLFWSLWNYVLVFSFLAVFCYAAAYFAREDDERPQAPSAAFLIFNDMRARVIAAVIVAAVAFLRACPHSS